MTAAICWKEVQHQTKNVWFLQMLKKMAFCVKSLTKCSSFVSGQCKILISYYTVNTFYTVHKHLTLKTQQTEKSLLMLSNAVKDVFVFLYKHV